MTSSFWTFLSAAVTLLRLFDTALSSSGPFPADNRALSPRINHAIRNINSDVMIAGRGASEEAVRARSRKRALTYKFIDAIWKAPSNQDLVNAFLNNKFTVFCARSSDADCLPLYRKYTVSFQQQDYFFLEDYVKYKAHRLLTLPEGDLKTLVTEAQALADDANYTIGFAEGYVSDLKGSTADLAETNRKIPLLAYSNFLQNQAQEEDWFNMHVISIPCIYGWTQLAAKLKNDPLTKNGTIFYRTWIVPNADPSFADSLTTFLDANQDLWQNKIDTGTGIGSWTYLVRTTLRLETALFASVYESL
ncbi:MAG: hypothetical protein HETSPECPRED_008700 [Heterodermia speciosa]|uniref:Thiaminase-2/PQQC domain-containing protein n=1 Tax=Heterodermia speciosa TaxID=116794 RepID=A0A8H3IYV1_9LECA|nr:MAG: hypothetical protein HETSPECPRED_008700 [Heterodermia speciosa]